MKKISYLLFLAVVAVVLTSCSSSENFAHRKYLDGGRLAKGNGPQKPGKLNPEAPSFTRESTSNAVVPEAPIHASTAQEVYAPLEAASQRVVKTEAAGKEISLAVNATTEDQQLEAERFFRHAKANVIKQKRALSAPSRPAAEQIVEVILAFLLPPLAVYLHDGIGTKFWVSLILTLFFWFPGVIFALLVVLDII